MAGRKLLNINKRSNVSILFVNVCCLGSWKPTASFVIWKSALTLSVGLCCKKKNSRKVTGFIKKKLRNLSEEIEKLTPERWGRPTLDQRESWCIVGHQKVWAGGWWALSLFGQGRGFVIWLGKKIVHQLCENWRIGRTDDFLLWFTSHFQFLKCSGLKPSVTK